MARQFSTLPCYMLNPWHGHLGSVVGRTTKYYSIEIHHIQATFHHHDRVQGYQDPAQGHDSTFLL